MSLGTIESEKTASGSSPDAMNSMAAASKSRRTRHANRPCHRRRLCRQGAAGRPARSGTTGRKVGETGLESHLRCDSLLHSGGARSAPRGRRQVACGIIARCLNRVVRRTALLLPRRENTKKGQTSSSRLALDDGMQIQYSVSMRFRASRSDSRKIFTACVATFRVPWRAPR